MSLFDWFRPAQPHGRASSRTKECRHCATALPVAARFCFVCGREAESGSEAIDEYAQADGAFGELHARLAHTLEGRYRIRDVLGAGGMGVVFLAEDLALDRAVAIKVLPTDVSGDATVVSRFRREAKTAARLDHPGIIPIYRVEHEGGLDYFIMKYVAGRSLEGVLREEAPMTVAAATRILREASAALAHAHRHGVVHRDVKPANIMLDGDERVILTDFGISKASTHASRDDATTEPALTEVGTALGTPQYMAPEQAVGHAVDGRADQYALATVGFEMLTGDVPFNEETPHAIIHRHLTEAPPDLATLRPDVPRHVCAVIARGLRKSPASRFATMEEFAAALDDVNTPMATPARTRSLGAVDPAAATRVLPADDGELDTALDRVFDRGHGEQRPKRRLASWMMAAVVLICGLGVAAWAHGGLSVPRRVGRAVSRATATKIAAMKAPPTPTGRAASKPVPPGRAKETARRTAALNVTSTPRAAVYVDGVRVGETPMTGHTLTVGRTYQVRVERKGYRTKRETITPTGTRSIRRNYALERAGRR